MEQEFPSTFAWTILDNLNEGVLIAKMDGTMLYINRAARTLLNLNQERVSLAEVSQMLAPNEAWQTLFSPSYEIGYLTISQFIFIISAFSRKYQCFC